ncbi:restriction endonuclease subunit S [Lachnospiraceae bacterium LCP25S3_G4]
MREYCLDELFDLQMGKTPSRNNSAYWNNGSNDWISIGDLSGFGKYVGETKEQLTDLAVSESGIKSIPVDTVVMSFKLSIGKLAITTEEIYSNEAIMAFIDKEVEKIYPDYLYYLLLSKDWNEGTNKAVMGKTLNKATLSKVKIKLHEFSEQEEIVLVLDKVDKLLTLRKQQLEDLDNLIKSRFVEMFGDPTSNPYGWGRVQLDDCLENIDNGKSFVCENNARVGSVPAILKLSAVTYGIYKPDENKAIIDTNDFVENAEVHDGDLLFTRKNTPELVGMSAYVKSTPKKLMMPDLIFRLNAKDNCHKVFLWQLINHKLFRGEIQNLASGSAKSMSNISKERLRKLVIALPPIDLQNQFATFVQQVDKLKVEVQKSLEETQLLLDSLMQKYFE